MTLVKEFVLHKLDLKHEKTPSLLKGFGNTTVQSLGKLSLAIGVDGVEAM